MNRWCKVQVFHQPPPAPSPPLLEQLSSLCLFSCSSGIGISWSTQPPKDLHQQFTSIPLSTPSETMKYFEIGRTKRTKCVFSGWEDFVWSINQAEEIQTYSHKSNDKQSVHNDKTRSFCTRFRGHPIPASLLPQPCRPCRGWKLLCTQGRSTVDKMLRLLAVEAKIASPLTPLT